MQRSSIRGNIAHIYRINKAIIKILTYLFNYERLTRQSKRWHQNLITNLKEIYISPCVILKSASTQIKI